MAISKIGATSKCYKYIINKETLPRTKETVDGVEAVSKEEVYEYSDMIKILIDKINELVDQVNSL